MQHHLLGILWKGAEKLQNVLDHGWGNRNFKDFEKKLKSMPVQLNRRYLIRNLKRGKVEIEEALYIGDYVPNKEPYKSFGRASSCFVLTNRKKLRYIWGFQIVLQVAPEKFDKLPLSKVISASDKRPLNLKELDNIKPIGLPKHLR